VAIDHVVSEGYRAIGMGLGREGPLASGVYSQAAIAAAHPQVLHIEPVAAVEIAVALQQLGRAEANRGVFVGGGQHGRGARQHRRLVHPLQGDRHRAEGGSAKAVFHPHQIAQLQGFTGT
jgi:hypothetical protein